MARMTCQKCGNSAFAYIVEANGVHTYVCADHFPDARPSEQIQAIECPTQVAAKLQSSVRDVIYRLFGPLRHIGQRGRSVR